MRRPDGSIQSHATPTYANVARRENNALFRCMVIDVLYTDDPDNITSNAPNARVLYKVVVLGGFQSGQIISNVRLSSTLGGNSNFFERVLRASSKAKDLSRTRLSEQDGDIVYVQFIQGHTGFPVIMAMDSGLQTKGISGATADDGARQRSEFNGIFEEINKNGEWCFIRKGGKLNAETGVFEPTQADADPNFEAQLKFTDNIMVWEDPNSSITFKKDELFWEHIVGKKDGVYKEEIDGKQEKVTRTYKSGLKVEEDGKSDKVTITTKGGVTVEIDGNGGKVSIKKGSTEIELDGNGDKIALKGGFIDLGSSVSDFAVLFTELATAFSTHTHITTVAGGSSAGAYPTSPPTAPLLATVGSQTVKVQP